MKTTNLLVSGAMAGLAALASSAAAPADEAPGPRAMVLLAQRMLDERSGAIVRDDPFTSPSLPATLPQFRAAERPSRPARSRSQS